MTLRLVKDDNGIVATGILKDADTPRDLTGATVALIWAVPGVAPATITCTADPDQTTNRGKFTATLTSTHLAVASKDVECEVQVTDGGNIITYSADAASTAIIRPDLS
jgi:hypothetical protein